MKLEYIVKKECLVKEYMQELNLSKRFCKKVKLYGSIKINDIEAKNYFPLKIGDKLTLEYNESENGEIQSYDYPLDIVYEDDDLLVINKPIGLASQPSHKHFMNNVVSFVKAHFEKNNIKSNVHVVNRLDYQTSGLMVIAKNGFMHYELTKEKIITRKYYCVIDGIMDKKEGTITKGIARECEGSIKRIATDDGQLAITHYKVIAEKDNRSLVDVLLETGRTHQIRVHFSYLGYPLIGDKLYGYEDERLFLHCYNLSFKHPKTNELIDLTLLPEFYESFKN